MVFTVTASLPDTRAQKKKKKEDAFHHIFLFFHFLLLLHRLRCEKGRESERQTERKQPSICLVSAWNRVRVEIQVEASVHPVDSGPLLGLHTQR